MQANTEHPNQPFAEVLAEILTQQDSGVAISRDDFIRRYPEHRDELSVYFDNMWMVETINDAQGIDTHTDETNETLAAPLGGTGASRAERPANNELGRFPTFKRYEILDTLGQGAMGAVYLARDRTLDRKVALKVPLLPENSPKVLNRFIREAKTAASLQHRNICPLFDIGEENGRVFITMAYVKGKPLSDYIKSGRAISQTAVAKTIRKLAIALHEAHENGVVHRDLKPANVMVDSKGEPIVMDFGLARQENLPNADQLTQSGMILGTPAYMSPEQIRDSGAVGPSADIYSLGVMMYQMLTGSLPYTGDMMSVISKILTTPPAPPSSLRNDIDPELEAICLAAMEKDTETRPTSMQDLALRLTRYLKKETDTDSSSEDMARSEIPEVSVATAQGTSSSSEGKRTETDFSFTKSAPLAESTSQQGAAKQLATAVASQHTRGNTSTLNRSWLTILGVVVIAGVVLLLPTKHGFIRIEVTDPDLQVVVNSTGAEISGLHDETFKVTPGDQSFRITRGEFEFETDNFLLERGEDTRIKIEWLNSQLVAVKDGKALNFETIKQPEEQAKPPSRSEVNPATVKQNYAPQDLFAKLRDTKCWLEYQTDEGFVELRSESQWQTLNDQPCMLAISKEFGLTQQWMQRLLERLPGLHTLSIAGEFDPRALEPVRSSKISKLSLEGTSTSVETCEAIGELFNLSELHLYACGVTNRGFEQICKLKQLTGLEIGGNRIGGESFKFLSNLTELDYLYASNPFAKSSDSEFLLTNLRKCTRLQVLSFHALQDSDLEALAKLPSVHRLSILSDEPLRNLDALAETNVQRLEINYSAELHKPLLQSMEDLQDINGEPKSQFLAK